MEKRDCVCNHRYYPVDFKYKVLQDVFENHLSLQEAALKYGIPSPSTVLMWQRKYKNVGLSGLHGGSRLWSEDMITKENDLFKEPEEFVDPKPKIIRIYLRK